MIAMQRAAERREVVESVLIAGERPWSQAARPAIPQVVFHRVPDRSPRLGDPGIQPASHDALGALPVARAGRAVDPLAVHRAVRPNGAAAFDLSPAAMRAGAGVPTVEREVGQGDSLPPKRCKAASIPLQRGLNSSILWILKGYTLGRLVGFGLPPPFGGRKPLFLRRNFVTSACLKRPPRYKTATLPLLIAAISTFLKQYYVLSEPFGQSGERKAKRGHS